MNEPTKYSFLIADDDTGICELLAEFIQFANIRASIVSSNDGIDAIRKLKNQSFDLVILDLKMPKADGHSVIKFMREGNSELKKVPVILMSGHFETRDIKSASDLSVKNFLVKPFNHHKFIDSIKKAIHVDDMDQLDPILQLRTILEDV